jgi:hypothetical protein
MVYYFRIVGYSIYLFLRSPKMSKRFKISIIHTHLKISLSKKIIFQTVSYTGGEVPDGNTALGIRRIKA